MILYFSGKKVKYLESQKERQMHPLLRKYGGALALAKTTHKNRVIDVGNDYKDADRDVLRLLQFDDDSSETPIFVRINSNGGSYESAIRLYDTMRLINAPTVAVVVGLAYSSAVLALLGATVKIGMRHSRYFVHNPGFNLGRDKKVCDLSPDTDLRKLMGRISPHKRHLIHIRKKYLNVWAEKSGIPREKLLVLMRKENFWTASEARKYRLIDAIA